MGDSVGTIYLDLAVNQNGIKKQLNNIGSGVKTTTQKMSSSFNGAFKGMALAAAAALAVITAKVVDIGKKAVEMSSDLQEAQNVVDTAFGSMSYKMEEFSKNAIKSFGMSELSAKRTGSKFMAMAKGMDIPAEKASDMALSLTGLSGDIASFYNISQELAEIKLASVFTGETETLKDLGIVMTQANLQAFALSKGITQNIQDMTQAEQVQLRYAYILKQTALAQGDFAKTSESWANQTRILQEQWKQFLTVIGDGIIRVLTPLVRWLNIIVEKMIMAAAVIKKVYNMLGGINDAEEKTAEISNDAGEAIADVGDSAKETSKKIKKSLMGFDELNILTQNTADNSKDTSDALSDLGNIYDFDFGGAVNEPDTSGIDRAAEKIIAAINKIKAATEIFKKWFEDNFAGTFRNAWANINPHLDNMRIRFAETFKDMQVLIEPFKNYISNNFVPFLQTYILTASKVIGGLFEVFNQVFFDIVKLVLIPFGETLFSDILPVFTDFGMRIYDLFGFVFEKIKDFFLVVWVGTITPAIETFVGIWQDAWSLIHEKYTQYAEPVFEGLKTAVSNISDIMNKWYKKVIQPVCDYLLDAVKLLWKDNLKPMFSDLLDAIGEVILLVLDIRNKAIYPLISIIVDKAAPTVENFAKLIIDKTMNVLKFITESISNGIESFRGLVKIISGLINGDMTQVFEGFKMFLHGFWEQFKDMADFAFKSVANRAVDRINSIIDKFNAMLGLVSNISGGAIDFTIPNIPEFAAGGVVTQPTLAVVGERGREAVMPLENNTGWIDELALKLSALMPSSHQNTSGAEQPIILQLNETELGRAIVTTSRKYNRQVGVSIL